MTPSTADWNNCAKYEHSFSHLMKLEFFRIEFYRIKRIRKIHFIVIFQMKITDNIIPLVYISCNTKFSNSDNESY